MKHRISVESINNNIRDFHHKFIIQLSKNKQLSPFIMSISINRIIPELIQNNMRKNYRISCDNILRLF